MFYVTVLVGGDSQKGLCPRLIDYVVIVGARTPSRAAQAQPPELLHRYPSYDHKVKLKFFVIPTMY